MKTTRYISRKKSIFITFLISYVGMLIIPVVIGAVCYFKPSEIVKSNIENYNMAMLEQAQKIIDEELRAIDSIVLDIALNPKVQEFAYYKYPMGNNEIYKMANILKELSKHGAINNSIYQVFVYFKNSDIILNNSAKYSPQFYFNEITPYKDLTYEEWYSLIGRYQNMKILSSQALQFKSGNKDVLSIYQSFPLQLKSSYLGTVGIEIDMQRFKSIVEGINLVNKGVFYIVDKDEIIMSIGNEKHTYNFLNNATSGTDKNYFYDHINGEEIAVSYIPSRHSTWLYVSIVPIDEFMGDLKNIRNIIVGITVLGLLLGFIVAYLMAKRNYKPIREIVEQLKARFGILPSNSNNEIVFLNEVTAATLMENQKIRDRLKEHSPIIRTSVLTQLLRGNTDIGKVLIKSNGEFINMHFRHENFCVILVTIDDCSKFISRDSIDERSFVKILISDTCEKYGNIGSIAYPVDIDWDEVAVILNYDRDIDNSNLHINEVAKKIRDTLSTTYSIFVSVGIGSLCEGLGGITESYKDARRAKEYKMIKGKSSIISIDQIPYENNIYVYSLDTEYQLINTIKVGDADRAKTILKKVLDENFVNRKLSMELARCLFFDIMSTIIKLINEMNVEYLARFNEEFESGTALLKCGTIDEMSETINKILMDVCEYLRSNKKSHNEELRDRILAYINDKFMDNNICLTAIAEEIEITPNYLSTFFKEQVGKNIAEYINELRINEAKRLLLQSYFSVSAIAEVIGYTNSSIFIRAFKKYEGITPGQYRESIPLE